MTIAAVSRALKPRRQFDASARALGEGAPRINRSQFQLGQVPIEKIWINPKSRDDIPAVLKGLQHIWSDEELRARLLALLDEHILPEADRTVGRPGMDLWQILVLGVLKQGLGYDFDRLHDLTNHHGTIREFLN